MVNKLTVDEEKGQIKIAQSAKWFFFSIYMHNLPI